MPFISDRSKSIGITAQACALLTFAIFGWGISWPFLKIALAEISPWTFRGLITASAAVLILSLSFVTKYEIRSPKGQWREIILASFLNVTLWHIFSAFGIRLLGGGQASIIAYTMPLWAVVFSIVFLGERATLARIMGLVVGMSGLSVLLSGELGVMKSAPVGTIFMLIAAVAWGAGTVVQKKVKWQMSAFSCVFWQFLLGGLPITVVAVILDSPDWQPVSIAATCSTIFVVTVPIILCWFAWFRVIDMVPVSISTVCTLLVPILGVASSNMVLGEVIGWREVFSLILICIALAFVLIPIGTSFQNSDTEA